MFINNINEKSLSNITRLKIFFKIHSIVVDINQIPFLIIKCEVLMITFSIFFCPLSFIFTLYL